MTAIARRAGAAALLALVLATGAVHAGHGRTLGAVVGPHAGFVSRLASRAVARWDATRIGGAAVRMRERWRGSGERPFAPA